MDSNDSKENMNNVVATKAPSMKNRAAELDEDTLMMLNGGSMPKASSDGPLGETLQQKFARFKKERQRERKLQRFVSAKVATVDRTDEFRDGLRQRFIAGSKQYLGVPYSAKYHPTPDCEYFNAPLYLDCCGLVRRVLQDLADDFGFKIGRWNQAYQFDSLAKGEISFEEMQPGDLVFVEGTYFNPKSKQQKYNIVHVEIFLGGETGEQTIGARHQRGAIMVHDSYKYTSKSYEITRYFFRSLEPWLRGELTVQHPEHWSSRDAAVAGSLALDAAGKRSIFDADNEGQGGDEEEDAEGGAAEATIRAISRATAREATAEELGPLAAEVAPVFFVEKGNGWPMVAGALERRGWRRLPFEYGFRNAFDLRWVQGRSAIDYVAHLEGQLVNHIPNNSVVTTKLGLLETLRLHLGDAFPPPWFPESYRLDHPADALRLLARHKQLLAQEASSVVPGSAAPAVVWILKPSGANRGKGIRLVASEDQLRNECFGESAESKQAAAAEAEAEAMLPPRVMPPLSPEHKKSEAASGADEPAALSSSEETAALPGTPVRGSAVTAVRKLVATEAAERDSPGEASLEALAVVPAFSVAVAQRYLCTPLLLDGRKFDLRVYGLVARASPGAFLCLGFANGYARLSLQPYSLDDLGDAFAHLTNASVQKRHADYKEQGGSSLWSMAMVEESLVGRGVCEPGWATSPTGGLQTQAKMIMTEVLAAAAKRFQRKEGYFDLLGFDLIVDQALRVHLLEVNTNPALHRDNAVLEALLPIVVDGTVHAVLEAHGRPHGLSGALGRGAEATPEGFEVLIDEKKGVQWAQSE